MFTNGRLRVFLATICLLALSATPAFAAAPGNDDFENRTVIAAIPYSDNQDASEATTQPGDPDCDGAGPTVWYEYTPDADLRLEANTFGSDYDTTLVAAIDDGTGGLDIVACNDDAASLQSRVRFNAFEGETYYFMVGAYAGGAGGELVFNLLEAPAVGDISLDITLDGTGRFTRDGRAIVTGTLTCSGADWVELYGQVSQRVGRFNVIGWTYDELECDGQSIALELEVGSPVGRFAGGHAQVSVEAFACGDDDCTFDFEEARVRLRR